MQHRIAINSGAYITAAWLLLSVPMRWLCAITVSMLVHECGHWLMLRICGCKIKQWRIQTNGMRLLTEPLPPGKELLCALAGPLFGMLLVFAAPSFPILAVCALVHSAFNLLPIDGQDGHRILTCLLSCCFGDKITKKIAYITQSVTAVIVVVFGIWASFVRHVGLLPFVFGLYAFARCFPGKSPCKLRQ